MSSSNTTSPPLSAGIGGNMTHALQAPAAGSNTSSPPSSAPFDFGNFSSSWFSGGNVSSSSDPATNSHQQQQNHSADSTPGLQATSADPAAASVKKEHRHMWSAEETDALVAGCTKHGVGNWKAILHDPELRPRFSAERHPGDLKDRFRTKFPEAYHELYPNAKTHVTEKASRKVSEGTKSHFEKGKNKERRCFTPAEDAVLKQGYDIHGSSWTVIAKDPVFEGRRKPTDLRDRFRNAFPELYEQAGYKPRLKGGKSKDRRLSHGSSHVPHSHHGHAVPLPDTKPNANADLDSVMVRGPDGKPTFARSTSSLSSNAPASSAEERPFSATSASSEANSDAEAPVGFDGSGSVFFDKTWLEATLGVASHRPDSSTQSEVSSASGLPEMVRSLSFGSGMPVASNGSSSNSRVRPTYNAQFSLPAGASSFAQAIEDGLVPEQAVSHPPPGTHSKSFSEQDERARMAQWHLQQAHMLQQQAHAQANAQAQPDNYEYAAFPPQHQQGAPPSMPSRSQSQTRPRMGSRLGLGGTNVQSSIQSSLRRSQSSKRASSTRHHNGSASEAHVGNSGNGLGHGHGQGHASSTSSSSHFNLDDGFTGPWPDWMRSFQQQSSVSGGALFAGPSGQSQSLPPSQAAPANFDPNNLDMSIDDAQLRQINELLQNHAADSDKRVAAGQQPESALSDSPATQGSGGGQLDGAMEFGSAPQTARYAGPYNGGATTTQDAALGHMRGGHNSSSAVDNAFLDYRGSESDTGTDASGSVSNSESRAPSSIGFTGVFPNFGDGFPSFGPPSDHSLSSNGSIGDEEERIDDDGYDEDEEDDDEDLDGPGADDQDDDDLMPRSDTIQPGRDSFRPSPPLLPVDRNLGDTDADNALNRSYFSDTEYHHPSIYRSFTDEVRADGQDDNHDESTSLSQTLMTSFAPSPSLRRPRSTDTLRQVMADVQDATSSLAFLRSVGGDRDDEEKRNGGNGPEAHKASPEDVYAESLPDLSSFANLDVVFGDGDDRANQQQQGYSFDDLDLSALLRAQDDSLSPTSANGATPSLRAAAVGGQSTSFDRTKDAAARNWIASLGDFNGQGGGVEDGEDVGGQQR